MSNTTAICLFGIMLLYFFFCLREIYHGPQSIYALVTVGPMCRPLTCTIILYELKCPLLGHLLPSFFALNGFMKIYS